MAKKKHKMTGDDVLGTTVVAPMVGGMATQGAALGLAGTAHQISKGDVLTEPEIKNLKRVLKTDAELVHTAPEAKGRSFQAMIKSHAIPAWHRRETEMARENFMRRFAGVKPVSSGKSVKGLAVADRAATMAHELGHVSGGGINKSKPLGYAYALGRNLLPMAGGFAAGAVAGAKSKPEETKGKTLARGAGYGAAAGLVGGAPTIIEEGRATYRGLRGLRQAGVKGGRWWRSLGALLAAGATYPVGAAGAGAISGVMAAAPARYVKDHA